MTQDVGEVMHSLMCGRWAVNQCKLSIVTLVTKVNCLSANGSSNVLAVVAKRRTMSSHSVKSSVVPAAY